MKARLLLMFVILFPTFSHSQQSNRFVAFGGYSFTDYYVNGFYNSQSMRQNFNGWDASLSARLAPHISAEADFAAGYSPTNHWSLRTYMGGPRIFADFGKATVYGHVLFGGLTFNDSVVYGGGATSFAMAVGGGADYWFTRHIGVRAIQVDYLYNQNNGADQNGTGVSQPGNNVRIATGVVFRFGH